METDVSIGGIRRDGVGVRGRGGERVFPSPFDVSTYDTRGSALFSPHFVWPLHYPIYRLVHSLPRRIQDTFGLSSFSFSFSCFPSSRCLFANRRYRAVDTGPTNTCTRIRWNFTFYLVLCPGHWNVETMRRCRVLSRAANRTLLALYFPGNSPNGREDTRLKKKNAKMLVSCIHTPKKKRQHRRELHERLLYEEMWKGFLYSGCIWCADYGIRVIKGNTRGNLLLAGC